VGGGGGETLHSSTNQIRRCGKKKTEQTFIQKRLSVGDLMLTRRGQGMPGDTQRFHGSLDLGRRDADRAIGVGTGKGR